MKNITNLHYLSFDETTLVVLIDTVCWNVFEKQFISTLSMKESGCCGIPEVVQQNENCCWPGSFVVLILFFVHMTQAKVGLCVDFCKKMAHWHFFFKLISKIELNI